MLMDWKNVVLLKCHSKQHKNINAMLLKIIMAFLYKVQQKFITLYRTTKTLEYPKQS